MRLRLLLSTLSVVLLTTACGYNLRPTPRVDLLGEPSAPSAAAKTIFITPTTRWVNVTGGEIVRFVADDNRSFAWNFDVQPTITSFSLNQVAPPGVLDHPVIAYVAPNPIYLGGRRDRSDR